MPNVSRIRSAIGGMLPERTRYVLWQRVGPKLGLGQALGHQIPAAIDIAPLDLIRTADRSALADAVYLESRLLPELGLNEDLAEFFPSSLQRYTARGLRSSQYPRQFAAYLAFLRQYPIRSYLEIGVQHGGTFLITVEFLRRFQTLERAVAMDMFDVPALHAYTATGLPATLLRLDSRSRRARREIEELGPFDLVLVDGDHAEAGCRADFELVRPHASMIAFHDIAGANTPGVAKVWTDIRAEYSDRYDFVEFTQQYEDVRARTNASFLGLGVAVRKGFGRL